MTEPQPHILVVDDHREIRDLIGRYLVKNGFRVTVSHDGYASQEIEVTSGMSGGGAAGMAGNVVFGGVIGAVVDGTSGAMKDLSPNPLVVVLLTPAQQRAADAERARTQAAAATTASQ